MWWKDRCSGSGERVEVVKRWEDESGLMVENRLIT